VVDEAEEHVADRVAVGHGDAEAEVRDAPLGVLGAVDRVHHERVAALARLADLLGDDPDVLAAEVRERRVLGRRVERRGDVAALAVPDRARALLIGAELAEDGLHVLDRRAAEPEPGAGPGHTGWKSRPEVSFG